MRQISIPERTKRIQGSAPVAASARTRQTERTRATRRKLLDAAKRIFAQQGFEAARLEDIAAGAGYTRGAFYANFKGKEDIFFAIFEEWVQERIESFTSAARRHFTSWRRTRITMATTNPRINTTITAESMVCATSFFERSRS